MLEAKLGNLNLYLTGKRLPVLLITLAANPPAR